MFRRILQTIKKYLTGSAPSLSSEGIDTQDKHPVTSNTGTSSSSTPASRPTLSSESAEQRRSVLVSTPLAPTGLEPEDTRLASSEDVLPPPPYSEAPPRTCPAPPVVGTSSARGGPETRPEVSHTDNKISSNTLKPASNVATNQSTRTAGVSHGHQSRSPSDNCSTTSSSTECPGEPSSADSLRDHIRGWVDSVISGIDVNGTTVYQTNGPGYSRNVFVASNGAYMANMGNTISITSGAQSSRGFPLHTNYTGANVWNAGSTNVSMHSTSLSVDLVDDSIIINGCEYPKKQGVGPLGHLTEVTTDRVVVDGHIYYPNSKST